MFLIAVPDRSCRGHHRTRQHLFQHCRRSRHRDGTKHTSQVFLDKGVSTVDPSRGLGAKQVAYGGYLLSVGSSGLPSNHTGKFPGWLCSAVLKRLAGELHACGPWKACPKSQATLPLRAWRPWYCVGRRSCRTFGNCKGFGPLESLAPMRTSVQISSAGPPALGKRTERKHALPAPPLRCTRNKSKKK